jgi:hypothetical protein
MSLNGASLQKSLKEIAFLQIYRQHEPVKQRKQCINSDNCHSSSVRIAGSSSGYNSYYSLQQAEAAPGYEKDLPASAPAFNASRGNCFRP